MSSDIYIQTLIFCSNSIWLLEMEHHFLVGKESPWIKCISMVLYWVPLCSEVLMVSGSQTTMYPVLLVRILQLQEIKNSEECKMWHCLPCTTCVVSKFSGKCTYESSYLVMAYMSCWVFYIQPCFHLASLNKSIKYALTHQKSVIHNLDSVVNKETLVIAYISATSTDHPLLN